MKIIALLVLLSIWLFASIFDDLYLFKAQRAFQENKYQKSLNLYKQVEKKSDDVYYNMGNLLYKQARYDEAIEYYTKIKDEKLNYEKLHNIGNCYVGLEQINRAIDFYASALKYKKSALTLFNLKLAQKIQKELEFEEAKKNKKIKDEEFDAAVRDMESLGSIDDFTNEKVSKDGNYSDENSTIIEINDNISTQKSKNKREYIENKKYNETKKIYKKNAVKFSDFEERKWDKVFEKRKLDSLLIPLNNGDMEDEQYAW